MGISKLKEVSKIVPFLIDSVNVPANSTYTEVIDIGEDFWEVAQVTLWIRAVLGVTSNVRRTSAYLVLTRDYDEAYSQATNYILRSVQGYSMTYYLPSYKYEGFSFATDAKLSEARFASTGSSIQILRGKIDGTDVKIDFKNTTELARTLQIEGKIRLSKIKVL